MEIGAHSSIHEALVKAVEIFSQPLLEDQIAQYAFSLFNEIFTMEQAYLFVRRGEMFHLIQVDHAEMQRFREPVTDRLERFPLFHAGLLTHDFAKWFSEELITTFSPKLLIPLSMNQTLFGWILTSSQVIDRNHAQEWQLAHSMLYLIQSALQRSEQQKQLESLYQIRDKNMYTMLALHTYTASLLTQTSLELLYQQAVDAFRELVRSEVVSLAIWDDTRQHLGLVAYHNERSPLRFYTEFHLKQTQTQNYTGRLFDLTEDAELLSKLFVSIEEFQRLSTRYVILLGKESIIGLVTLSDSEILGKDRDFFEIIRLLASITYLSIMQTRSWLALTVEKESSDRKYQALMLLNQVTQSLGQCLDLEELLSLLMTTLTLSAHVTKVFILLHQNQEIIMYSSIGLPEQFQVSQATLNTWLTYQDMTLFDYTHEGAVSWFHGEIDESDEAINCFLMIPWWRYRASSNETFDESLIPEDYLGCIGILGMDNGMTEDMQIMIETISLHIKPFLQYFNGR